MKRIKPREFFGTKIYFCWNGKLQSDRIKEVKNYTAYCHAFSFPMEKLNITWFLNKNEAKDYLRKKIDETTSKSISTVEMPFMDVRRGNFFTEGNFLYLKTSYDTALRVENGEFLSESLRFYQFQPVLNKIGMNLSNFIEE